MIDLSVGEINRAIGGETESGLSDIATFASISTDSRTVKPGDLFIALRGNNFDGHNFLTTAVDKGAMGIIAARDAANPFLKRIPKQYLHVTLIRVDDTLKAYHNIARLACRKIGAKVVAVTGSTGKTTTKDMIGSVLSQIGKTAASAENFNNEYGLPATILSADSDTEFMVLEMGMRGAGQIADLARIARPHVGVITNVGLTHYELLGSAANIAAAKAELAAGVRENGTVVLNALDSWTESIKKKSKAGIVTFGLAKDADVRGINVILDEQVRASFDVTASVRGLKTKFGVKLTIPGEHNIENALAAAAACLALEIPADAIAQGLANTAASPNRMSFIKSSSGFIVVNDTYNASPSSMTAAISTLKAAAGRRKIAVLGNMMELGEASGQAHKDVGRAAAEAGVDLLIAIGDLAKGITEGARAAGMPEESIMYLENKDLAADTLKAKAKPGDIVLVKASRAMEFERIVECIK